MGQGDPYTEIAECYTELQVRLSNMLHRYRRAGAEYAVTGRSSLTDNCRFWTVGNRINLMLHQRDKALEELIRQFTEVAK